MGAQCRYALATPVQSVQVQSPRSKRWYVEIIGRSSNVIKSRGRPRAWARSRTGSTAEAEVEREVSRLALKLWRPLEGQKSLRQHLVSLLHH